MEEIEVLEACLLDGCFTRYYDYLAACSREFCNRCRIPNDAWDVLHGTYEVMLGKWVRGKKEEKAWVKCEKACLAFLVRMLRDMACRRHSAHWRLYYPGTGHRVLVDLGEMPDLPDEVDEVGWTAFWDFAEGEMVRRGMGEMERQVFVYRCRLGYQNFKEWGRFAEENGLRCYSEDRLYDYWERVLAFLRELGRRYMNGLL